MKNFSCNQAKCTLSNVVYISCIKANPNLRRHGYTHIYRVYFIKFCITKKMLNTHYTQVSKLSVNK